MGRTRRAAVTHSRRGDVATFTLALAGGRLDEAAHAELRSACEEIDLDEEVRVVVLRSRGKWFCLGDDDSVGVESADGIAAVGRLRVPCVAVLAGDATDAGLELALACDLRIAAQGVKMSLGQTSGGGLPFHGGTQRLPRIVGSARAARMLLLGESFSARQALDAGLVHASCPRVRLGREVRLWVDALSARAPIAQRLAKETLRAAADLPLAEGLRLEGDLYVLLQTTRDRDEGVASFHEKRPPRFEGR